MNIKTNSKHVNKNDIFVCIHDELEDRHKYINNIKKASGIIIDKDISINKNIPLIKVNNTNDTLFDIYNRYYNYPLKDLNIIGITGTDGKTSTSLIIKQLLDKKLSIAYLGTNGFIYKNKKETTKNTTPSIEKILEYTNILKTENINSLVMETSSEGLLHNRCNNITFKRGIITNITKDHLNIHKTFDNYLNSKLKLIELIDNNGLMILNTDDKYFNNAKKKCKKEKIKYLTYGKSKYADYQITDIKLNETSASFKLKNNNKIYQIKSPLLGIFNVYNLTAAIACINSLNIEIENIIKDILSIKTISGRTNTFKSKKDATIILDYAHTYNAIKEILNYAHTIKKENSKIITLTGAAGGREKEKRKYIGKLVSDKSDLVILTKDDPRYEKVKDINNDLKENIIKNNYIEINNRKKAIKKAIKLANKNDIVLIIGKGTDNYMAIKNKYKKYNDLNIIKKQL